MDFLEALGLLVAAFGAGAINAVAGGGSLVSFPALVWAGYTSKTANVTNSVALWPGYVAGSYGYRSELKRQRRRIISLAAPSMFGALAGSVLLLATPTDTFDIVVPFLILFACGLMVVQERLAKFALDHQLGSQSEDHVPWTLLAGMFVLAIYGGYFGAGLGIMTLAVLGIILPDDIQHSNALKGLLSLIINAVAVAYFVLFGPVRWGAAVVMAVGAMAGGSLGVGVARRLGRGPLRASVVSYGVLVAGVMLYRLG